MRYLGLIGVLLWLCASQSTAYTLPMCYDPETSSLRVPDPDELASHGVHRPDPVVHAFGRLKAYDFYLSYVIDETGHVSCISTGSPDGVLFEMTPERTAFLDGLAAQTFTPFLTDGHAAKIAVEEYISEEERPARHVLPPKGDTATAIIRIDRHDRHNNPFTMTVTGDGKVTYVPGVGQGLGAIFGPQTYEIPRGQVPAMLKAAEDADFWSLRDLYYPEFRSNPERGVTPIIEKEGFSAFYTEIAVTLGGRTKTFRSYNWGGAPELAGQAFSKIAAFGKADLWWTPSSEMLTQLDQNGFDFGSDKAGVLLINFVLDQDVPEGLVNDLMARGAPLQAVDKRYGVEMALVDAAVATNRRALVDILIGKGAFLTDRNPDIRKTTRALVHAAEAALPGMVAKIMPYQPDLVYRWSEKSVGGKERLHADPVITFVGGVRLFRYHPDYPLADLTSVTQTLLDAGADINSLDSSGRSLLRRAAYGDHEGFVRWLLAKGAVPEGPIMETEYSDNMTVLLLEAGAKLSASRIDFMAEQASREQNRLPKTEAWLKAHGLWPANN